MKKLLELTLAHLLENLSRGVMRVKHVNVSFSYRTMLHSSKWDYFNPHIHPHFPCSC